MGKQDVQLTPFQVRWRVSLVYFIGFMDLFGVSMVVPFLPQVAYNVGASRSVAGLIGSLYGAIQIFSSPIMGKMSDEYGRKSILLLSYIGPSVGIIAMSLSGSVAMLVLARIPNGIFKHGMSISKAYLVDITKPEDRASVLGYYNAISSSGFIVGPLISGYLADWDPTLQLSLLMAAAVLTVNFFVVLFLLPPSTQASRKPGKLDSNVKSKRHLWFIDLDELYHGVNVLKGFHWREMKGIIVVRFLGVFAVMMFRQNFPVFMEENFSLNNADLGKVISYNGITAAIASATCGTMSKYYTSFSDHPLGGFLLLFLSLVLLVLSSNMVYILVCLFILSLSTSYLRICMLNLMLESGKPDEKGAILGFMYSLSSISRMLAPSVVGVAQEFGSLVCAYFAAILALAAMLGVGMINPVRSDSEKSAD